VKTDALKLQGLIDQLRNQWSKENTNCTCSDVA